MQLLVQTRASRTAYTKALGSCRGIVKRFEVEGLKVPHMGWNNLIIKDNALFSEKGEKEKYVYFVHSYHASEVPQEYVIGESEYGYIFTAAVQKDNIFGLQFHPEKSGDVGLAMLKNFGGLR